jgi:carbonic anhydrase/acetyltransferase-like protein (isoleucine patch superfamily)
MTRLGRRSRSVFSILVLMAAILLWASAVPAWAQVTSGGTVTGVVTDKSRAVVPGATVTLTDTSTRQERTRMVKNLKRFEKAWFPVS